MSLPDLNEQNAPVGTPLRPYNVTFDHAAIERYCGTTAETPADYEHGGRLHVPSGLLAATYGRLIHETFFYTTGVHVSSDLAVERAVMAGEPLRVTGSIGELFERNGNKYVRFKIAIDDADDQPVARVEHVSIYKLAPRRSS